MNVGEYLQSLNKHLGEGYKVTEVSWGDEDGSDTVTFKVMRWSDGVECTSKQTFALDAPPGSDAIAGKQSAEAIIEHLEEKAKQKPRFNSPGYGRIE